MSSSFFVHMYMVLVAYRFTSMFTVITNFSHLLIQLHQFGMESAYFTHENNILKFFFSSKNFTKMRHLHMYFYDYFLLPNYSKMSNNWYQLFWNCIMKHFIFKHLRVCLEHNDDCTTRMHVSRILLSNILKTSLFVVLRLFA